MTPATAEELGGLFQNRIIFQVVDRVLSVVLAMLGSCPVSLTGLFARDDASARRE